MRLSRKQFYFDASFALIAATAVASAFPGWLSPDSFDMYSQATSDAINDWHSPILTYIWSKLAAKTLGPIIPYLIQNIIFWLGMYVTTSLLRKKIGSWSLILPLGLIQFQFYWVMAWIWKDSFLMAVVSASWGLFILALETKSKRKKQTFEIAIYFLLGCLTFARVYLLPSYLLIGAVIFVLLRKDNEVALDKPKTKMLSIIAILAFILPVFAGNLLEKLIIKPTPSGAAATTMLLDLARVECAPDSERPIPTKNIIEGEKDICVDYDPVRLDPLLWPTNPKNSKFTFDAKDQSGALRDAWIEGFIRHPELYIFGRLQMFGANLFTWDWISPTNNDWLSTEGTPAGSNTIPGFGLGYKIGFPNFMQSDLIYKIIRPAYFVPDGSFASKVMNSNVVPLVALPISTLVFVVRTKKKTKNYKNFLALFALSPLLALNMAILAPSYSVRYFAPAALMSVVLSILVLSKLGTDKGLGSKNK